MEQNNFEKSIQRKLDELKIPPSDSVWINVEKRIPKKKKERKAIFILFFLLLFIAVVGYWLLNSENRSQQQNQNISKLEKKDTASSVEKSHNSTSSLTKTLSDNMPINEDSSRVASKEQKSIIIGIKSNTGKKTIHEKVKDIVHETNGNAQKEMVSSARKDKPGNEKNIDIRKEDNGNDQKDESARQRNVEKMQSGISDIKNKEGNSDSNIVIQNKVNPDTFLKKDEVANLVITLDSASKKIPQDKKNQWKLGITFSAGVSILGKDPFGINNQSSLLYSDYNNSSSSNANSGYSIPSAIKNSIAFMGGIFVEKNISPRNKISVGISYRYFSLVNKVGNRIDSTVAASTSNLTQSQRFYSAGNNTNTYRNSFHYLEIPVSFLFKLNRSESLPVNWLIGMNISQLISSNALQFRSSPGLYYSGNSLFHKTQIGLQTGLYFTFFAKDRNPLTVGPYISYNTSKLSGKGLYGGKHFSFIGVHSEILFQKK